MMKLAFSTNAYVSGKYNLCEAINEIADAGYEGVEILAENPLLWPFETTPKQIEEIRSVLKEGNIKPVNLNACVCATFWKTDFRKISAQKGMFSRDVFGPNFCDYEEERRGLRVRYMEKVIDLAAELGVKDISTLSGFTPLRGSRRMAIENTISALEEVLAYAKKKGGIRINLEYEPGLLVGSAEEAMEVIEKIKSPLLGLNFDIGHSFVTEGDVSKVIKEVHHKIHNVHVEDIGLDDKGRPVHYHLIPGIGAMPLEEILSTLEEVGFGGWYIVELYTYTKNPVYATRQAFKFMARMKELSAR